MMCFLWQHEIYLWYLPGTACLYSGPSPVDLACLRNHLLHACRYWYCGCHPQDTVVERDRTHYSFSSIPAVVYKQVGWFTTYCSCVYSYFLCHSYHPRYFSRALIWYVHTRRTLYEAKQGCGVVSCTTFRYWGACWSKVLVIIWYHMYVRTWGMLLLIFHWNISFFSRYLVVGSRYDFFFRFQSHAAQHMPVGFCSIPSENVKTAVCGLSRSGWCCC